jgi:hypothetical protein
MPTPSQKAKIRRFALTEKDHELAIVAVRFYVNYTGSLIKDITSVIGIGNVTLKMEADITHAKALLFKLEAYNHG